MNLAKKTKNKREPGGPFDGANEISGSGMAHPIEKIIEIRLSSRRQFHERSTLESASMAIAISIFVASPAGKYIKEYRGKGVAIRSTNGSCDSQVAPPKLLFFYFTLKGFKFLSFFVC